MKRRTFLESIGSAVAGVLVAVYAPSAARDDMPWKRRPMRLVWTGKSSVSMADPRNFNPELAPMKGDIVIFGT